MNKLNISVSVVIPYFNDGERIEKCISSVLEQSMNVNEIIIIDDCSTDSDNLVLILNKIRNRKLNIDLIYKRNKVNMNGAYSRNLGMNLSSGDFIALLDADDYWEKNHIELSIKQIIARKIDFIYSNIIYQYGKMTIFKKVSDIDKLRNKYDILLISPPQTNSFVFKREVLNILNFDESLRRHQDYQFLFDAIKNDVKIGYSNQFTSYYVESQRSIKTRVNVDSMLKFWNERCEYFSKRKLKMMMLEIIIFVMNNQRKEMLRLFDEYKCLLYPFSFNGFFIKKINYLPRFISILFIKSFLIKKNFKYKIKKAFKMILG